MTKHRQIRRSAGWAVDAWLVLRCGGRRVAVGYGPGQDDQVRVELVGRDTPAGGDALRASARSVLLCDDRFLTDVDGGTPHAVRAQCPRHSDGHMIDAGRLREVIGLRCRPGRSASVDVSRVERQVIG